MATLGEKIRILLVKNNPLDIERVRRILKKDSNPPKLGVRTYISKGDLSPQNLVESLLKAKKEGALKEKMEALEKANLELKDISRLKSDFVSLISHELRTPLTSIKESIGLVLDQTTGPVSEGQSKFLEIAKRNIDRLWHLINDVLDISKIEAGKMTLMKGAFSANQLAREAKQTFESVARKKDINIELSLEEGLPEILVDHDKTVSVFANLLSNGIKFMDEKGKIIIHTRRYGPDPNDVEVCIQDSGIGISRENIPKLFEKFSQLEGGLTRSVGGTGLGLAICKQIVELQGGKIWVESEENLGSRFHFTLPIVGGKALQKRKILIIDDEPEFCKWTKENLEASQLKCNIAANGKEGLKKVKAFKPDLILLDLMMPGMDGYAVCQKLKKDKKTASIPIVVLTAIQDEALAKKVIAEGASGYLVKPFESESLMFTIRELLKG